MKPDARRSRTRPPLRHRRCRGRSPSSLVPMANQGRRPAKGASRGTPVRRNKAAPAERFPPQKPKKKTTKVVFDSPPPEAEAPRTFRLGAVPGATPGKWVDAWKQRMPHVPLELVEIE